MPDEEGGVQDNMTPVVVGLMIRDEYAECPAGPDSVQHILYKYAEYAKLTYKTCSYAKYAKYAFIYMVLHKVHILHMRYILHSMLRLDSYALSSHHGINLIEIQ